MVGTSRTEAPADGIPDGEQHQVEHAPTSHTREIGTPDADLSGDVDLGGTDCEDCGWTGQSLQWRFERGQFTVHTFVGCYGGQELHTSDLQEVLQFFRETANLWPKRAKAVRAEARRLQELFAATATTYAVADGQGAGLWCVQVRGRRERPSEHWVANVDAFVATVSGAGEFRYTYGSSKYLERFRDLDSVAVSAVSGIRYTEFGWLPLPAATPAA